MTLDAVPYVFDFKSGAPGRDHREQMAVYSMWSVHKLRASVEDLTAAVVNLGVGFDCEIMWFSEEELEDTADRIIDSYRAMDALHADGAASIVEAFDKTEDTGCCGTCAYFDMCG